MDETKPVVSDTCSVDGDTCPAPPADPVKKSTGRLYVKAPRELFGDDSVELAMCAGAPSAGEPVNNVVSPGPKRMKMSSRDGAPVEPIKVSIPNWRLARLLNNVCLKPQSLVGNGNAVAGSSSGVNASAVHQLQHCAVTNEPSMDDWPKPYVLNSMSSSAFAAVFVFIDYIVPYDIVSFIIQTIINVGAKVEKEFNFKVTHVIFCNGSPTTFKTAVERNVPLVSATWLYKSIMATKLLDPADYPPVNLESYISGQDVNETNPPVNLESYINGQDVNETNPPVNLESYINGQDVNETNLPIKIENVSDDEMVIDEYKTEVPEDNEDIKPLIGNFDPFNVIGIMHAIVEELFKSFSHKDGSISNNRISDLYCPKAIRLLRKYLMPRGQRKSLMELHESLIQIETRLKLDFCGIKRLRFELYPHNSKLFDLTDKPLSSEPEQSVGQFHMPLRVKNDVDQLEMDVTRVPDCNPSTSFASPSAVFQTLNNPSVPLVLLDGIACSGIGKREFEKMKLFVEKLGQFSLQSKVDAFSKYLIVRRGCKIWKKDTLNLPFAMAYGCFIVSENWLYESYKNGAWLPHENYEIGNLSEPVKLFQKKRQTYGSFLTFHIFDKAGSIFLMKSCKPSANDLKRLVEACGGICVNHITEARIKVGENVDVKWILDCITHGLLLDLEPYKISHGIVSVDGSRLRPRLRY